MLFFLNIECSPLNSIIFLLFFYFSNDTSKLEKFASFSYYIQGVLELYPQIFRASSMFKTKPNVLINKVSGTLSFWDFDKLYLMFPRAIKKPDLFWILHLTFWRVQLKLLLFDPMFIKDCMLIFYHRISPERLSVVFRNTLYYCFF